MKPNVPNPPIDLGCLGHNCIIPPGLVDVTPPGLVNNGMIPNIPPVPIPPTVFIFAAAVIYILLRKKL